MSETRIRPRQVLILIIVFLVILLVVHRNGQHTCQGPDVLKNLYERSIGSPLTTIYAVTPTYARPQQKAELTRLSHLFMLIPNLHWIIVEDSNQTTQLVKNLLKEAGLQDRSTLLYIRTPDSYKLKSKDPNWIKPRGVQQRNTALAWIRHNLDESKHSIVYFMDDDNTYSIALFNEMENIQPGRVGVWPVGLVGGLMAEKPILDANRKVIGFNAVWRPERPFAIDMAGFAVSIDLFFKYPQAVFSYEVKRGYQETELLRHLTTLAELQPLANNCHDILVWHTRTETPKITIKS